MIARVIRFLLCLAITAVACTCASIAAADRPSQPLDTPLLADLDADGTNETVRVRETACFDAGGESQPPCSRADDVFRTLVVEVADTCAGGGGERALTLSREMEYVSIARILDADRDGQARELAFEVRAGASARAVQAKIVAFKAGADGCVAVRRTLFSYPRPDSIGRRPKGSSFSTGSLQIKDFTKRYGGLELRTIESYARGNDPGCCPTYERTSYWRFDTAKDRYRTYRTKLVRIRRGS
ncbi:MAG: hypothetical protein QOI64_1639 [Solirubrobacteraceae bacterium]|jgi:hypothetical protein|nr:hypothetical protein [Solirubrobacteraceae bacterium]